MKQFRDGLNLAALHDNGICAVRVTYTTATVVKQESDRKTLRRVK